MLADSELRMTVRAAFDVPVPVLDLRAIRLRGASVRSRRSRIGLPVLAVLLVPVAAFAYVHRDAIRMAIVGVFPAPSGPVIVRRDTHGTDQISMHAMSMLAPRGGLPGRMLYQMYARRIGLSPQALSGIPSRAHFEGTMVIARPDIALFLGYSLGRHGRLGIVVGRDGAALIKALALSLHDDGDSLQFNVTAMNIPPRRERPEPSKGIYRTWRAGSLRFIVTTDALTDGELAAIQRQSIAAQGSAHSGKQ
jgi:hypothetical protein